MLPTALALGTLAIVCGVLRALESPMLPNRSAKRLRWRSLAADSITGIVVLFFTAFPSGDNSAKGIPVGIGISIIVILHFIILQVLVGKLLRRMKHQPAPSFPEFVFFGTAQ